METVKDMMVKRLQDGETIEKYKEGGNSMTPLLKSRQPVDIRPVDRDLEVGDIVFAKVKGRYFMHLITAIDGERVQISNNHGHVNGWTKKSKVYGLVSASFNEGK
jgi:hypothetical protein